MSSNKIRIGYPGQVFEIPAPSSGMGFSNHNDVEVTELDSGGRHVYSKPTTYQSLNMSWLSTTPALQPLIDMYNKRYGRMPFYLRDLRGGEGNILPARWAFSHQLAFVAGARGWPEVTYRDGLPPVVTFGGATYLTDPISVRIMLVPGKDHYLAPFGARGGAAGITHRKFNKNTLQWEAGATVAPITNGTAPYKVCAALETETYDFMEISLGLSSGDFLQLYHMDFSTTDYRSWEQPLRPGVGYGGLEFTNELGGELTMLRTQRIGLSVDMTEVEG